MGAYASIVIYPNSKKLPGGKTPLEIGKAVVNAFAGHGLLIKKAMRQVKPDHEVTFVTSGLIAENKLHECDWVHFSVEEGLIAPALEQLVFSDPDVIVPSLDVSIFAKAIKVMNPMAPFRFGISSNRRPKTLLGKSLFNSWALVEFNYDDARIHEELHLVRDEQHPVFTELEKLFEAQVQWNVVPG